MTNYLPTARLLLGVVICCGWLTSATQGQLTHYVPFDAGYSVGSDLNGSGGSDLGFGANTWFDGGTGGAGAVVEAGNLTAPLGLAVAGNHARTNVSNFDLAFYTFDQDADGNNGEPEDRLQPGVNWISLVAKAETAADFGGFSLVKFFGPEVLYIGKVGGAGGTSWGIDAQDGMGAIVAGGDATVDTFLVAKLTIGPNANDDTVDLYINPPLGMTPPAIADLSLAFNEDPNNNRAIDEIRLGSQNAHFSADEIRIGATFADVTVPEPSLGFLMLLGLAAIGHARSRMGTH